MMNTTTLMLFGLATLAACSVVAETDENTSHPQPIQGMWVWHDRFVEDEREQDRLIEFCVEHGFNLLMVQIHQGPKTEPPRLVYPTQLARLIDRAAEHGIAIEALDGEADMAARVNQPRTLAVLDAIIDFNERLPRGKRLVGVHYDIEPYILDAWQDNAERQRLMTDYLEYLQLAKQKLADRAPEMSLSADIPFWYDHLTDPDNHALVTFNGSEKNLHEHVQDLCDYIGIMSYRRNAVGPNSVVEHVTNEMNYAQSIGKTICASLETVQLDDTPHITFFGTSPEAFTTQHALLRDTLRDQPGYGGTLVHHYGSLRDLLNSPSPQSETGQ